MLSFRRRNDVDTTVFKLLSNLSIHIDEELIKSELEKHPDYPSLLSISDVLTELSVENGYTKCLLATLMTSRFHSWFILRIKAARWGCLLSLTAIQFLFLMKNA